MTHYSLILFAYYLSAKVRDFRVKVKVISIDDQIDDNYGYE
jgi:hypothetical protein